MDTSWSVVLGAFIGAAATLGGSILTECIKVCRQKKADKPRRYLLQKMLEDGHKWRKLETLSNVAGLNYADTKRLLVDLGARGSETNGDLWGLISRNPIPTHDDQEDRQ